MSEPKQRTIAAADTASDRDKQKLTHSDSTRSGKFQYSGPKNPCPICQRTKDEDCHWNNEVVLCHTHVNQDALVPGYVYRGAKDIWGQYFPANSPPSARPIRPRAKTEYVYHDVDGHPLVKVTRWDDGQGKKRFSQSRWSGQGWVKGLNPDVKAKLRLYKIQAPLNQAAIANKTFIFLVEGEGKVDRLLKLGIAATCAIGGAGKWRQYGHPNYLQDLANAEVVLCPDQDQPGLHHCRDIKQDFPNAQWLYADPSSPLWDNLPSKNGRDIVDWIAEGATEEAILAAVTTERAISPININDVAEPDPDASEKQTVAQKLLAIAAECNFFHTPDQKAYVDVVIRDARHTLRVKHASFKTWLQHEFFTQSGKPVGSETLNQVLNVLEGKALFVGEERDVYVRIAAHNNKVYIDLGTDDWSAVEVSADGWQIVSDYPVRFRRPSSLLPLPLPERGGSLDELQMLLNLNDEGWLLVLHWLLFSFYPHHPHPILVLHGEQGTGKSYTARLLKNLIDPGKAPLIPQIGDLRNLAITAANRWVLAYDNLSHLPADQSDALCRISTGGGFTTRALYANDEETVFEFTRPQILTGIDSLANRGDLLERSLLVNLIRIPETERVTEAALDVQFAQVRGRILGTLLTTLSQTLRVLPTVQNPTLPRMADFAQFAIAAENALGLPPGNFLTVYGSNRQDAHATVVESSPVAISIQRLLDRRNPWQGTATELLAALTDLTDEVTLKRKGWPGTPKALGKVLTRLAPDLRGVGILVSRPSRHSYQRRLRLEKGPVGMSYMSPMSPASPPVCLPPDKFETNAEALEDATCHRGPAPLSSLVSSNVTTEMPSPSATAPPVALSDKCDKPTVPISIGIGQQVKKRGKRGWQGQVQELQTPHALVLWNGACSPDWESLEDLEVVESA